MNTLKLAKIGLISNVIFWVLLLAYFGIFMQGTNVDHPVVRMIYVGEIAVYAGLYLGVRAKNKFFYVAAVLITAMNALLSITDQVGVHDILSFIVSAVAFGSLLLARDNFFKVKK